MRTMLLGAALCGLVGATAPASAQDGPLAEWRFDTDADGDGVADGWTILLGAGGAVCSLVADEAGAAYQHVAGAREGDRLLRTLTGLDPLASYLITAVVAVSSGAVAWGADGLEQRYVPAYARPLESGLTVTGHDAVTVAFAAQEPGTSFSVAGVRVERIAKRPLPVEADTGRSLVPRPMHIEYSAGETEDFLLATGTPVALVGLEPTSVGLELFVSDVGLSDLRVVDPEALPGEARAPLVIASLAAMRAGLPAGVDALAEAAADCPENLPEEGYHLTVRADGVVLIAQSDSGAQHGLQTLRQLCSPAGQERWRVPKLTIGDWPEMPFRGAYQLGATPSPERLDRARYFARLKLNAVVMEDEVFYHLREGDNMARVRDYCATLRGLHLEPIPLVQSFGWGMYLLAIDPQCVEARYVEGRPMRFAARETVVPEARGSLPADGREYLVAEELLTPLGAPIADGSFEQLAEGRAAAWQADRWSSADGATVSDNGAAAGARCLALSRQTRGTARVWQDFEVPERQSLRVTVRLRLAGIEGGGAYAEIYRVTPEGALIGNPVVMVPPRTGTRDWESCAMELDTLEHRWYRVYLRIQDAVGSAWFDEVGVCPVGAGLRNLVHVEDSLRLTDQAGNPLAAGQDYEVIPGETAFPFTADAEPWQIARLPGGRIPAGAEVRVSYEYAPAGAATYCPSDPRTQAIMRETLGTVVRELGVKRIHIGHDEPRWMNTCLRCRERHLTNAELLAEELTRMREYATAADPEVRVMMWADALNPFHNAPAQGLEPANDTTPKDIIQCAWFYSAGEDVVEARSLDYFAKRGYETTGSPWYDLENSWDWARECHLSRQATGKCLGMLYTSWGDHPSADPWAGLSVTAAYSWNPVDPPALGMLPWSPAEMNRAHGLLP